jgi:hypothetical protein
VLLWLVAFGIYAAYFQAQWVYGERPIYFITGDEPHYLTVATSLIRDGDLDVLNNYRGKDYSPFYPYHLGDPRDPEDMHALYGPHGQLYSKHSLGLPLLLAPALLLGGHGAVKLCLMALSALLAVQTFLLALEATGRLRESLVAWAMVCFTVPMLLFADQIYPEVPGALLTILAVRGLVARPVPRWYATIGACIGLLPWLHLRYVPLAVILAVSAALRLPKGRRGRVWALLLLVSPALAGGAALLAIDYRLYGGVPRVDEYGSVALANLPVGLPGLLLDRQYGLIVYAPSFLVPLLGLPLLTRRRAGGAGWTVLTLVGSYFAFIGSFSFWFGAFSPPARMLVPIIPLLVIPAALALARWRGLWFRVLAGATLLASWSIAHLLMDVPRLRYNLWDGQSQALAYLSSAWGRDVSQVLPSFVIPSAAVYAWALIALLVLALLWLALELPAARVRPAARTTNGSAVVATRPISATQV